MISGIVCGVTMVELVLFAISAGILWSMGSNEAKHNKGFICTLFISACTLVCMFIFAPYGDELYVHDYEYSVVKLMRARNECDGHTSEWCEIHVHKYVQDSIKYRMALDEVLATIREE